MSSVRASSLGQPSSRLEHLLDRLVVEAVVAADDARVELVGAHVGGLVQVELDGHREPVHARVERADAVGEPLGQHRQHAVDQVDGGRALNGLPVDDAPPRNVVAHVGDVHPQPPAALVPLERDGVVEVARVDRVDGDGEQVAQVDAAGLGRADLVGDRRRRVLRPRREGGAQPVLADDDLDVDARVGLESEDLLDLALRGLSRAGELGDAHDHDLAGDGATEAGAADEDVALDAAVGRRDDRHPPRLLEPADDVVVGPLDHAKDLARLSEAARALEEAHRDGVGVHGAVHVAAGDVDVAGGGRDEPVSARVDRQPAGDLAAGAQRRVVPGRMLDRLAGAHQLGERLTDLRGLDARCGAGGDLRVGHPLIVGLERLEDRFAYAHVPCLLRRRPVAGTRCDRRSPAPVA